MQIIEKAVNVSSRTNTYRIYPIGDVHLGKINCAESHFKTIVARIKKDPLALWVGGGDMLDCISQHDPRWDSGALPEWMDNRKAQRDPVRTQLNRLKAIIRPIKDKCIGLIEGNHEYAIRKHYDRDIQAELAEWIGVPDLTDCAFIRFRFNRASNRRAVVGYIAHGHGGGRTAGAEPNHLTRMISDKEVDFACRGHSHTYCVLPPVARLYIPKTGTLPQRACREKYIRALNWGTYVLSYSSGPSTYESRAQYPSRPLITACIKIQPFAPAPGDSSVVIVGVEEINMSEGV